MTIISSGYRGARPVTYLFIDGGYLRPEIMDAFTRWFGADPPPIQYHTLMGTFGATKMFYYDCPVEQKGGESAENFEHRREDQETEFRSIRALSGAHVRFGTLVGAQGKRQRQKEVDVLLTVDMLNHAMRGNMDRAILLAGDGDFRPLVDMLVQIGMNVTVAAIPRSASRELTESADYFMQLRFNVLHQWAGGGRRIPDIHGGPAPREGGYRVLRNGLVQGNRGNPFTIYGALDDSSFMFETLVDNAQQYFMTFREDELRLFAELQYGQLE